MNAVKPIDFDLGDDLSDMLGTSTAPRALPADEQLARIREQGIGLVPAAPVFKVDCQKCRGRGRFISYSGRDCGPCFACKGKGHFERKTSPVKLAASRASAAARKERVATDHWTVFAQDNEAAANWIMSNKATFEFAAKMHKAVLDYGDLTEGQMGGVNKCIARNAERAAARQVEQQTQADRSIAVANIAAAFAMARAEGLKKLALRYDGIKIKQDKNGEALQWVGDHRQWPDQTNYGRISGDRFMPRRDCPDAILKALAEIDADPAAAAKVYGKKTGSCCCCGAELTDPVSIANGIGPICAENYGF